MTRTPLTRRRFARLAGGTALVGLAGCSETGADGSQSSPNGEDPSTPTATDPPTDAPAEDGESTPGADGTVVVEMLTDNQGTYFSPKGLAVDPGTTVRFVNVSGGHGTTAYHPDNEDHPLRIPEAAEPWESPIYTEADATFEVTLTVEGVYDFYCPPHESMGMVGRLVVGEPQGGPGTTEPEELPPGARDALPAVETIVEEGTVPGP